MQRAVGAHQQAGLPVGVAGTHHLRDARDGRLWLAVGADQQLVLVQQLLDNAEHLDVARGQHDQVVADPFQVGEQVGGEHHRHALLGHAAHEGLEELAAGQWVEAGKRLVQQQEPWPLGQC